MSDATKEEKVERVKLGDIHPEDCPPTKVEEQDLGDASQAEQDEYIGMLEREVALSDALNKELAVTIRRAILDYEERLAKGVPDASRRKLLLHSVNVVLVKEWSAVMTRCDDEQARIFKHIEIAVFRDITPQEFLNDWGIESRHDFGDLADDVYDHLVKGHQRLDPDLTIENLLWFLEEKIFERNQSESDGTSGRDLKKVSV